MKRTVMERRYRAAWCLAINTFTLLGVTATTNGAGLERAQVPAFLVAVAMFAAMGWLVLTPRQEDAR